MLGIGQIRRKRPWLICALATAFLVNWYYLSPGLDTRAIWIEAAPPSRSSTDPASSRNTTYTKTLVIAKLQRDNTSWVDNVVDELQHLTSAVYTADNPNASLTVPMNKGNEVMVYLTYIIDHYFQLSDVTMFMHSQSTTWHNNGLLEFNSALMVKLLKSEHVIRSGYMNLRCHLEPGCPEHIHPATDVVTDDIAHIPEAEVLGKSWKELFPNATVPEVLSQPCCSQFAVSAEHIRKAPLDEYVWYRDWLLETALEDHVSGRLWEYIWQWLFTGQPEYCPGEMHCYCEGYGVCFDPDEYSNYFRMRDEAVGILGDIQRLKSANDTTGVPEGKIPAMKAKVKRLRRKMEEIKDSVVKHVV